MAVFSDGLNQCYPGWVESCINSATPYVLIAQSVRETEWTKDSVTELLSSYYRRATRAYFVSRANLQFTKLQYCLSGENFEIVRNPFNAPYAAGIPWPSSVKGWRMAFVGRLEPGSKGCDLLISVLSSQKWRSRPVTCHFYGSGNNQRFVKRMAEMLGATNCIFHGRVASVLDVWRENHILVLPSRYEGLPLAIVEAMLCARPVITTDVSGNAEMLEDDATGFVAAAPSAKSLAEAMERA